MCASGCRRHSEFHFRQRFAIHLQRDKTYTVSGSGTLQCSAVKTGRSKRVATEKMAVQLHVYVRMKLNGKLGI